MPGMIMVERLVRAERGRLWEILSDVPRWADLLPTVTRVSSRSGSVAPRVGARYALTQPGIPPLVYQITVWEPGRRFVWVARSLGVRTVASHEVDDAPQGSTLRLGLAWEGLLAPLVRWLFGRRTQSYVEQEADTFVRRAEEDGHPAQMRDR